jgi:hypothetical protein
MIFSPYQSSRTATLIVLMCSHHCSHDCLTLIDKLTTMTTTDLNHDPKNDSTMMKMTMLVAEHYEAN